MPEDNQSLMHRRFISIGSLGSLGYQRRWCINGAVESGWVDLYELIETTIHAAKHKATHPVLSRDLSAAQREALTRFHASTLR